jgi:hypothetical protein
MKLNPVWWAVLILSPAGSVITIAAVPAENSFLQKLIVLLWLLLPVVAQYPACRALAQAQGSERGDFGRWLWWGLLAYLPGTGLLVLFEVARMSGLIPPPSNGDPMVPLQAGIFALSFIIAAPLLIHASGQAVSRSGPSLQQCRAYCSAKFPTIASAIALAYFLPSVLGGFLMGITSEQIGSKVAFGILTALPATLAYLWASAIALGSWRLLERQQRDGANQWSVS